MERAREWRWVTADTVVSEVLRHFPVAGQILLQHGGMFQARKGDLYASYPSQTIAEYGSRGGIGLEALLGLLNAAAETDELARGPDGGHCPGGRQPGPSGRGPTIGYTGTYREPARVDVQELVAVQTARGPE